MPRARDSGTSAFNSFRPRFLSSFCSSAFSLPSAYLLSGYYHLVMVLPIKSSNSEPATATIRENRLKPVIPSPNISAAKNPLTRAPAMPRNMAPKIPPLSERGSIRFAIMPAIRPNTIQASIFIGQILTLRVKKMDKIE